MRFFCLVHNFPLPVDDGSNHRVLCMLETLASWGETRVAVSPRTTTTAAEVDELERRVGVKVLLGDRPTFAPIPKPRLWAEAVVRRVPPWFLLSYDPAMPELARRHRQWATHLVALDDFAAQYLPALRPFGLPVVLDKHQVYAAPTALGRRPERPAARLRRSALDHLVRTNEARTLRCADRVIVTSEDEAVRLESMHRRAPDAVVHSGFEQDLVWTASGADPARVLWLGSIDSRPNREGLDDLLGHLRSRFGTSWPFRLVVAGRGVDDRLEADVRDLPVDLLGFVEDLDAVIRTCGAAVIPLRAGGGVRIKTLQLLGSGIPVVTTPVALEGVPAVDGEHCRVAPTVAPLVDELLGVLADQVAAAAMGARAHELVASTLSWSAQHAKLRSVL